MLSGGRQVRSVISSLLRYDDQFVVLHRDSLNSLPESRVLRVLAGRSLKAVVKTPVKRWRKTREEDLGQLMAVGFHGLCCEYELSQGVGKTKSRCAGEPTIF